MAKLRISLNAYDNVPEELAKYFRHNGMHFNKRMYEFAVSLMFKRDEDDEPAQRISPITKEEYDEKLKKYGISIENDTLYDGMYVYCMCKSDYLGNAVPDDMHAMLYVKHTIDDPDQKDGFVFNRFYNDCVYNGIPIDWDYMNG